MNFYFFNVASALIQINILNRMSGFFRSKKSSKGQRSESSEGTSSNPQTTFQGQMTARRASLLETAPEVPFHRGRRPSLVPRGSCGLRPRRRCLHPVCLRYTGCPLRVLLLRMVGHLGYRYRRLICSFRG